MPIALSARTWIGKPTPSVVLGAVSLLPSDPSAATHRSARKERGGRVQARPCLVRVPRLELGETRRVAGADQQDVAGAHADALFALRRFEVLAEHVLARLQPRNTPQARDVEQHPAADEAVLEDVDRVSLRTLRGDRLVRLPAVERAVERDVAEGVDVAVPGVVVIERRRSPWRSAPIPDPMSASGNIVMWWSAGEGLSIRACVFSGWLSVTVIPLRISPAAATIRSAVRW